MELHNLTITKIQNGLRNKDFSVVELITAFLDRIKQEDEKISAFLSVEENSVISQAKKIDELISCGGELTALAGIPLAVKDNILVKGMKATCASKILENYVAPYDATCVKKLKSAGAVILGKTNLDEFAMGGSTENSGFFTTKNPNDLGRVPGGSSGGSAAAVAADMCCFALGSDTGGAIRQPASFCGVVGLKPTYGSVSRYGLVAFASSLDQIGPITKTAEDAKLVFDVISGKDPLDSTSIKSIIHNSKFLIQNLRVGVPKEYFIGGMDKEVEKIIRDAIKRIEDCGAKIEEISLPNTKYALAVYYLIATSEASANLARYDGIRYGGIMNYESRIMTDEGGDLLEHYLTTRGTGFGDEVKRRIMLGTFALSAGYYNAYYLKAQKVRTLIKNDFEKAFQKVNAIFTPASPTPAFKIGENMSNPLSMYLADIFTVSANLTGLPAISIPIGFTQKKLPIGLQIIGKPFEETKILEIVKIYGS